MDNVKRGGDKRSKKELTTGRTVQHHQMMICRIRTCKNSNVYYVDDSGTRVSCDIMDAHFKEERKGRTIFTRAPERRETCARKACLEHKKQKRFDDS